MRRARTLVSIALALAFAVASCTDGSPSPPAPGGGASVPPRAGGTLRVVMAADVDALDPHRAAAPPAWGLLRAMHRGLMAFPSQPGSEGARPVPDLAEADPAVSADGRRYQFRLREGVAFAAPASRPVRAADVKAGLERSIAASSPIAGYLRVITGAPEFAAKRATEIAGIAAPDERTVVITLTRPVNDFLWLLSLPAASAVPPGLPPVTSPGRIPASGPYRLDEGGYVAGRSIRLVRNLAWNKDADPVRAAWVDRISVELGIAPPEIQRRLLAGEADLSGDVPPAKLPAGAVGPERLVRAPNGCLRYVFMNATVAPFGSPAIRAAVAAAVDRAPIVASYGGGAVATGGLIPQTVDGYDPGRTAPTPAPTTARAALAAAGRPGGFSARMVIGSQALDTAHAAAIRTALAAVGIRIDVRAVPIALLYEDHYEVRAADVSMGISTWCADWPGRGGRGALTPLVDGRTLAPRGNTNYSSLNDRRLNALLEAAAFERNADLIADRWRAAGDAAIRLATIVPLAFLSETSLLGPDVRGFVAHPYFVRGDLTAVWLDRPG